MIAETQPVGERELRDSRSKSANRQQRHTISQSDCTHRQVQQPVFVRLRLGCPFILSFELSLRLAAALTLCAPAEADLTGGRFACTIGDSGGDSV